MKLRELHLDDVVVIPGHAPIAGGTTAFRDQSFHVDDGWDLSELSTHPGIFVIGREDMASKVIVGGYGYSFVPMPGEPEDSIAALREGAKSLVEINEAAMQGVQSQSALVTGNAAQAAYAQQHHRKGKR